MRTFFSLFISFSVWFLARPAVGQSLPEYNIAVGQLASIMAPNVFKLERQMVTFHYESDQGGFQPHNFEDVQRHVMGWPDRFFDANIHDSEIQGPGEYVSIDPAGSRNYGRINPRLFVITLKRGTRILETQATLPDTDQATIISLYEQFSCADPGYPSRLSKVGLHDFIRFFRSSENVKCRQLVIDAAREVGLQAIMYSFSASVSLESCRGRDEAVNVLTNTAINSQKISYYDSKQKIEGFPITGYLVRLYPEAMRDFGLRLDMSELELASPLASSYEPAPFPLYRSWKRQNLFKCGRAWTGEIKSDLSNLIHWVQPGLRDESIAQLILRARSLLVLRPDNTYKGRQFEITRMNAVVSAELNLIGSSAGPAHFKEMIDDKDRLGDEDNMASIEAELGESGALAIEHASEIAATSYSKDHVTGSKTLYQILRSSGLGPRLALIEYNQIVLRAIGGAPYLVSNPEGLTGGDLATSYATNRDYYIGLLRSCIAQYSDRKIPFAKIDTGPCGFN